MLPPPFLAAERMARDAVENIVYQEHWNHETLCYRTFHGCNSSTNTLPRVNDRSHVIMMISITIFQNIVQLKRGTGNDYV